MEKEVGNDVKLLDKSTHPMSKRGEKTFEVAGPLGVDQRHHHPLKYRSSSSREGRAQWLYMKFT